MLRADIGSKSEEVTPQPPQAVPLLPMGECFGKAESKVPQLKGALGGAKRVVINYNLLLKSGIKEGENEV